VVGEHGVHLPGMREHQPGDPRQDAVAHVDARPRALAVDELLQHEVVVARGAEPGAADRGLEVRGVVVDVAGHEQASARG